jgi:hypothetical protein
MTDLVAWLREQIDEDERAWQMVAARDVAVLLHGEPLAPRMLAEVAAKRQLLTICVAAMEAGEIPERATWSDHAAGAEVARDVLAVMAQPYAGRPGWREEWGA